MDKEHREKLMGMEKEELVELIEMLVKEKNYYKEAEELCPFFQTGCKKANCRLYQKNIDLCLLTGLNINLWKLCKRLEETNERTGD